jgi:hypothetical protein
MYRLCVLLIVPVPRPGSAGGSLDDSHQQSGTCDGGVHSDNANDLLTPPLVIPRLIRSLIRQELFSVCILAIWPPRPLFPRALCRL